MSTATPGITFRETMTGAFALGETEPAAGARAGSRDGTELTLHATVTVRDVERFVSDPRHTGRLTGRIDFSPLAPATLSGEGIFRISCLPDEPEARVIAYELPLEHGGEHFCLAAWRELRSDPGADPWKQITTLFARLHRGDADGPVAGSGILGMEVTEFTRVLICMRAVDVESATEGAGLITRFGQHFAGDLWKSYVATIPR